MSQRTPSAQAHAKPRTRDAHIDVFDVDEWTRLMNGLGHNDDASRARAMGIHQSRITRIRAGESRPGIKFISACNRLGLPYGAIFKRAGVQ